MAGPSGAHFGCTLALRRYSSEPGNFRQAEYEISVVNNWDVGARIRVASVRWSAGGQQGDAELTSPKDLFGRSPLTDRWVFVLPGKVASGRVVVRREHLVGLEGAKYAVTQPSVAKLAAKVRGLIRCAVTLEVEVGSRPPIALEVLPSPPAERIR